MSTHQCSMSLKCASKTCPHSTPHKVDGCDRSAPCGDWPDNPDFKPTVLCIPVEQVKPRATCPNCGQKEVEGHHTHDCIRNLQNEVIRLRAYVERGVALLNMLRHDGKVAAYRARAIDAVSRVHIKPNFPKVNNENNS